ncbi:MAG TPA: M20/M25/M40 family metallo-hydrolase, partial [Variovorax sp.]|nr:M20/M25/M40 family metallo-hydrolase [Variovorax sp.]
MSLDRTPGALAVSVTVAATLAAALVAPARAQTAPAASPLHARIAPVVAGMYPSLETLYQDLHAHPEIAFQEVKTAARMAGEMRRLGFEVTEKIGRTGVVAIYRNGPGPTVMVRTELDALPMEEKTGLPYASRVKTEWNGRETFVAHSCGHDIHMSSWLASARTLAEMKAKWKGTLVFIAQPAEEIVSGANLS